MHLRYEITIVARRLLHTVEVIIIIAIYFYINELQTLTVYIYTWCL